MSDWLTQNAVVVINACVEAFDRGDAGRTLSSYRQRFSLFSNRTQVEQCHGLFDALAAVERERRGSSLKDANRDKKGFGHGAGYLYPHAYRDRWRNTYLLAGTGVLPAIVGGF